MKFRFHDHTGRVQTSDLDVTDRVMDRLGFEQRSPNAMRRERLSRHGARLGGFLVLVVVILLGTLLDRALHDGESLATLPVSVNESKAMRAQALSGLLAPFERLEQVLDSSVYSWGDDEHPDSRLHREVVDPTPEGPTPALFDAGKAAAPFSSS